MAYSNYQIIVLGSLIVIHGLALAALLRGRSTRQHKIVWSLAILLLPVIGVVAYVFWGHSPRDAHLPP